MDMAKESPSALVLGVVEEFVGGRHFNNDSLVEEGDFVRHSACEADLVGHNDHRHTVVGKVFHNLEYLADKLGIESRGRFVEEEDRRAHDERAGDRDALLLPPPESSDG
ncbi:hypothetical protein StoSoilB5_20420 [Arthrobacter sp. StoSoilB5]|nr:hypothetical protein StoSoilB5_20420 [Arthrobacter sp. StoSoilB5]